MISPPRWSNDEFVVECNKSIEQFIESRRAEPLEVYLELFDEYRRVVEDVLEETVDLTQFEDAALAILSDPRKSEVFRYMAAPPVSKDDLKTLMRTRSLAPKRLVADPELLARLVAFIRDWHDRQRFPWVSGEFEATEQDRNAAIISTTALLASRALEAIRRKEGKKQEMTVAAQLRRTGFKEMPARRILTLNNAPESGEFCPESMVGTRKADFVIGLYDGRKLLLECKVSNSVVNSIKRVKNDAAVKAEVWRNDFGNTQIIPAAVLGGVFDPRHLEDAQQRGLTLFWAHDLQVLADWLHSTGS